MPTGKTVQANGLEMYYEETGAGEPLVLIHGGTVTCGMWQPYLPAFASHFRVITPDSRAHGRTDNPTGELSYALMAEDIAAFIRALNLDRPLVVGYSDGGQIALELGMRFPGLTRALVVGAAWYKFTDQYQNWLIAAGLETPGVVDFKRIEAHNPGWVKYMQASHTRPGDPDHWQALLTQIARMWWEPLQYTDEDFLKIREPMLILQGDRDEIVELEQALEMYRIIPGAELAILPGANHMTPNPPLMTEVVLDFLLRHSGLQQEEK
jgi:pimeloyl-ACP methyl ester carboxylesterase